MTVALSAQSTAHTKALESPSQGVYSFTQTRKNWTVSPGEDRYRRTLYTMIYRSAPHPLLTTFDATDFNTTCTRRPRSDTPLQSLNLANLQAASTRQGCPDVACTDLVTHVWWDKN